MARWTTLPPGNAGRSREHELVQPSRPSIQSPDRELYDRGRYVYAEEWPDGGADLCR